MALESAVTTKNVELKFENVNIGAYPSQIYSGPAHTITFGDMHGNSIKLIWSLIKEGVLNMPEADFDRLTALYAKLAFLKDDDTTYFDFDTEDSGGIKEKLDEFQTIINKANVAQGFKCRFLGDIYADRGHNDYLTLLVFNKLNAEKCETEILFSNHDAAFIHNSPHLDAKLKKPFDFPNQYASLTGISNLVKTKIVPKENVQDLINMCLLDHLKFISYALTPDQQRITLFMHAPNDYITLKTLATKIGIEFHDESALALAKTIDALNIKLNELIKDQSFFHDAMYKSQNSENILYKVAWGFAWNYIKAVRNYDKPPFIDHIVHGHVGDMQRWDLEQTKEVNLDTDLGKIPIPSNYCQDTESFTSGTYVAMYTNEPTLQLASETNYTPSTPKSKTSDPGFFSLPANTDKTKTTGDPSIPPILSTPIPSTSNAAIRAIKKPEPKPKHELQYHSLTGMLHS